MSVDSAVRSIRTILRQPIGVATDCYRPAIRDKPNRRARLATRRYSVSGSIARRFGGSAVRRFGGSAVRRFGGSAVRRFGGSAARRFGGSAVRRLGGSAARRLGGSAARRLPARSLSRTIRQAPPPHPVLPDESPPPVARHDTAHARHDRPSVANRRRSHRESCPSAKMIY
ncbi:hypothetical protein BOC37_35525 [Burkholderia pseudomallei]|nr:hypothetical protein BOC37_35525 [Burkholderia pseudomallei]